MPQREGTGWSEGKTIAHELMENLGKELAAVKAMCLYQHSLIEGRIWSSCFGITVEEAQRTRNPAQSDVRLRL